MKAILLAAGVGSRICNDIQKMPKSMLLVNEQPLIVHTVKLLRKNNIAVTVITGYMHQIIEDAIRDLGATVYYNPFFKVTNSMGSLWYARDELAPGEDVMIANADVYYTQELLDLILSTKKSNFLLSDKTRVNEGDYFFGSENGVLKRYGKQLLPSERDSEYVGIGVLKNEWIEKFRTRLCQMIESGQYDLWWENVLYSLAEEEKVYTVDVDGIFWSEVDTISDYHRVLEHCRNVQSSDPLLQTAN